MVIIIKNVVEINSLISNGSTKSLRINDGKLEFNEHGEWNDSNLLPSGINIGDLLLLWDGNKWISNPSSIPDGTDSGQILIWNGSNWIPSEQQSSLPEGTNTGQILIWNGTNWIINNPSLTPTIFYVSKNGNDSNNGNSILTPFLTLQKAYNTIADGNIINVIGSEIFDATGIIPDSCKLYAPNAILTGEIIINSCCVITTNRIIANSSNSILIKNIGYTERSIINVNVVTCSSGAVYTGTSFLQNQDPNSSIVLNASIVYTAESGEFIRPVQIGDPINLLTPSVGLSGDPDINSITNIREASNFGALCGWYKTIGTTDISGYILIDYLETVTITEIQIMCKYDNRAIRQFDIQISNDPTFSTFTDKLHTYKSTDATNWVENIFKNSVIVNPTPARYLKILWKKADSQTDRIYIHVIKTMSESQSFDGKINVNIGKIIMNTDSTLLTVKNPEGKISGYIGEVIKNTGATNTTFAKITNGSIKVTGNSINVDKLYELNSGELFLNYLETTGTETHISGKLKKINYTETNI